MNYPLSLALFNPFTVYNFTLNQKTDIKFLEGETMKFTIYLIH